MPAGRPRKLDAVRQRTHTPPTLAIVPTHEKPEAPRAPAGLLTSTRKIWRDLFSSPLARAIDLQADSFKLLRWIKAVDEYQRCQKVFTNARMVKGSTGQPVLNPLASYLSALEATITRIETEFGMGPLSRMRLGIATGQAALTADELNRRLDEQASEPETSEVEAWEGEWEQA